MTTIADGNWLNRRIEKSKPHQDLVWKIGANDFVFSEKSGKKVTLSVSGQEMIEFMSCSYLGLEDDSRIRSAAKSSIDLYGMTFAAARTRMRPEMTTTLDNKLSQIIGAPTTTFSTVGLCHLAVLPLLGANELPSYTIKNQPHWIIDQTSHASIQVLRGILEQFGKVTRVNFQDAARLKQVISEVAKNGKTPITLSDGVGSMGGLGPVREIMTLAEEFSGYAYIDDAHGTSIMGPNGAGYAMQELGGNYHPRLILTSSLAKAFGSTGGAVSVYSAEDEEVIRKYSNPYIFGGPLAIPTVAAASAAADIHLSDEIYKLQDELNSICEYFDMKCPPDTINFESKVPIRGLFVGEEEIAIRINKELMLQGFACTVAMYPTVPFGQAMIRIALSRTHYRRDIDNLLHTFSKAVSKEGI
ncbi:aminotransferase class I/II-fold pyridoxal phosphate-dependent enzyme [Saccharospirillum impatiens]|uniref:aminotransferase class I/II-fold pyridoxal phosphate-dependent enzyme n=1 Tax=Saccharospirillum impatiens TaxID=169438 RepID=UPI00040BF62F|nr:aminotransferase class I/II-fold pyridoxal phosphate-dependent enzyme [Saccharospirillum impatiens]